MARKSYLNASKMTKMCRVCLTQCNNVMYDLADKMDLDDIQNIPILDALEKVVYVKILLNDDFPKCICPMCISMLKMTFKFVRQFGETQKQLKNIFGKAATYEPPKQASTQIVDDNVKLKEETDLAPVEIIIGTSKFDLKDVFVIEEVKNEESNFKGFLENLGREVSATFTDKSKDALNAEPQCEDAISIYMTDNESGILPVKELKIYDDTNGIDYILVEEPEEILLKEEDSDPLKKDDEDNWEENEEENDNIEYIEIETFNNDDMKTLIIEATENDGEVNKENDTVDQPRVKKVIKVGKRKKYIKERQSDGIIIMEPVDGEEEQELQKKVEDEDDIFEREMQYPCEICKKVFRTTKSLRAHKKRSHFPKERQYTCETCGYKNKTRSGYMHHKVKHAGKQFVCEICSKTYYTRAVLKVHMATHINKRQHLCNVCGKGFNYANALIYHMRLHTGERNYTCDYCGEKFRMPNALKRHIRTHTGERPYKCKFCDRGFCSRGEVQCHENIHTGYRPYHCKHCRKGFTKTHNLKLHLLSHDGPHRCDFCGKSFIEMSILSMHYKISHKDLIEKEEEEEEGEAVA